MHPSRIAGVTLPLFSIRTERDWGIGQITDLPACAAWIARAKHRLLQLLPPYEVAGGETSPYGARTAFGLDPAYIGIEAVEDLDGASIDEALGPDGERELADVRARRTVDYARVRELKGRALRRAFETFHAREWLHQTARARALAAFVKEQQSWADDLALYVALRDRHGGYGWESWPEGERARDERTLAEARRHLDLRLLEHHYQQWIAHGQWEKARSELDALGVELMGDLPFIVCRESADVWARREDFRLDVSLGAPPDAYSAEGQDWGLPAYDWAAMDRDGLAWLRARTRHAAKLYDRFRLDHVVGYFRMYVRKPGEHGTFDPEGEDAQRARGERLLRSMLEEAGEARLIGEDLGVVPPFVRETLRELGVPGYRVIPWEKDDSAAFRDPTKFPPLSVATWSTHDTAPIVAWWSELPEPDRQALAQMTGVPQGANDADRSLALLRTLFASSSELTLVLAAELLGERDRINTPGTVDAANWTYRLPATIEQLQRDPAVTKRMEAIAEMVDASGR